MPTCPVCARVFTSQKGLVAHTEAKHDKAAVHRLTCLWENNRGQSNIMTTTAKVENTGHIYVDEGQCYDYNTQTWDCPQCYREFNSFRALEQHINSGVHSAKGCRCDDCTREFSSLTALMGHCESTSCVYANNIVQTLASDYERSPQLMLTNGNVTQIEATLYFDGSAKPNPGNGGSGYWLCSTRGTVLASISIEILDNRVTNNQAEYAALVWGMECAKRYNIKSLLVKGDSELVIHQMNGYKNVNSERMKPLYKQAKYLENDFNKVQYEHMGRHLNHMADAKANEGSDGCADQRKNLSDAYY